MKTPGRRYALYAAVMLACATMTAAPASATLAPQAAPQAVANARLKQLANDYYLFNARFEPLYTTFRGDSRFNDQLGLSIAPANRARRVAAYKQFQERLQAIHPARLNADDATSHAVLAYELQAALDASVFPNHLLPVNQMGSMPIYLANLADGKGTQPIGSVKEYKAYLNRLKQLTPWIDQAILNMRQGIKTGVVLPKALIAPMLPQYRKLAGASVDTSPYYAAIKAMPDAISGAEKASLANAYRAEIGTKLNPALARLADFLEKQYLPAGLPISGLGSLPNGAAWYQARVAESTTTNLTPEAIHATGLAEVARIQQQFAVLGPKLGYTGPAAGLPKWVGEQAKFMPFKSDQEILEVYRKLDVELASKLPPLFSLMPKAPLEQRLEPELTRATASDHYTVPSPDGSRPGIFWSVVPDATKYDKTKMTSLFLHEGRPGHHFQLALQLELALPDFRRFGGNNAYIEGWALYAETLGNEIGVFQEPDQYFGHLNMELLRAARLVVDTGLHAKGWTREQAIAYLVETNGYSNAVATNAIERYMAWPGQALGYKVGSLKIIELRNRASAAMGPKFSLPGFHAAVLGSGTLPLAVLEQKIDQWIAQAK